MLVVLAVLWVAAQWGCEVTADQPPYACHPESWCVPVKHCAQEVTAVAASGTTNLSDDPSYADYKVGLYSYFMLCRLS